MKIGNRFFDTKNHTYIMGILNVTPDSFSDGGKWNHMDEALKHTEAMIADGADIIDIGGESTRPGHTPVSADEEAQRVLPVIEAVKKHFDIPVSVDTFKSSVAESSIQAGADLVNDIWGLKYDPKMAAVIAKYDVACCLMHNKSNTEYQNFLIDMLAETQECVNLARQAGIKDEKIMLDPGIGFAKTSNSLISILSNLVSSITANPFCILFIFTICFVPVIYLRPRIASVIWITRLFSLTSWTRTKEHPFITPITLVAKVPSTR